MDILVDAIASLQLSTQEGSFVFASNSARDNIASMATVCSNGFNSIKTLPLTVWLPQSRPAKQQNEQRSSIFHHLLSLPISAFLASSSSVSFERASLFSDLLSVPVNTYLASSSKSSFERPSLFSDFLSVPVNTYLASPSSSTSSFERPSIFNHLLSLPLNSYLASSSSSFEIPAKTQNQSFNSMPMVNQMLFMPIGAFKSLPNTSTSTETENNKNIENNVLPETGSTKSLLNTGMLYSKEFWLRESQNT